MQVPESLLIGMTLAVGGAFVLAALAFRSLVSTILRMNAELRATIDERHAMETARAALTDKLTALSARMAGAEGRELINTQRIEGLEAAGKTKDAAIAELKVAIAQRDRQIDQLRGELNTLKVAIVERDRQIAALEADRQALQDKVGCLEGKLNGKADKPSETGDHPAPAEPGEPKDSSAESAEESTHE